MHIVEIHTSFQIGVVLRDKKPRAVWMDSTNDGLQYTQVFQLRSEWFKILVLWRGNSEAWLLCMGLIRSSP